MLNKQSEKIIDWTDFTWNPIAGCKHECDYCYCNRLAKRWNKDFKKYQFRENYLNDLNSRKLKENDKIFVGSSGDMWGMWVPTEDIEKVLLTCSLFPKYKYLFLTKFPERYLMQKDIIKKYNKLNNMLFGLSIDNNNRCWRYINYNKKIFDIIDFISFEPLLEKIDDRILQYIKCKWIIIGANSNKGEPKPPDEWIDSMIKIARENNVKIWIKDNYKYHTKIKEFPE
jgi:protein gp37